MAIGKPSEKRKAPRVSAVLVTGLKSGRPATAKGRGCIIDLSLNGLGFESEADFENGAEVSLTFDMPVEVHGKIVYADKKKSLRKYGVQFTRVDKGDKLRVEQYITVKFKKS